MQIKPMILCPLSPWYETTISKGPKKGQKVKRRDVLGFLKHDMFWGKETEGSINIDQCSHYGSMSMFLPRLHHLVQDQKYAVDQIIGALCKRLNKTPILAMNDPYKDLESLGRWMDNTFGTSYMRLPQPPLVYYNLFGQELGIKDLAKFEAEAE